MNIDIQKINNTLKTFLDTYLSDVYCACLTGSFVDHTFNDESDLDLWVISYNRDYSFHETFIREGLKIQVTHMPFSKIDEILWLDYFTRNGTYIGAFAKAQILKDTNDYLLNLIHRCQAIYKDGPKQMSVLDLQIKKALVINCLSDFKGNTSNQECFVILGELLSLFTAFCIYYNNGWINGGGKHQVRNFKKLCPSTYDQLFDLYETYLSNRDKKPLIEFFNDKLAGLEDLNDGYSVSGAMMEVKQPYMAIQIYDVNNYYDFVNNRLSLLTTLIQDKIECYFTFRTRAIGDSKVNDESLYIILFASSGILNSEILPLLNDFVLQRKSMTANFPVNLDLSLIFSHQSMIRPVISWIYEMKKLFEPEGLSETKALVVSIEIFRMFELILFNGDNHTFHAFLTYLNGLWSASSYDCGKFFRIDQLLIEKSNLEETFKRQYNLQKETLASVYFTETFRCLSVQNIEHFKSVVDSLRTNELHPALLNPVIEVGGDFIPPASHWIAYQNALKNILASLFIAGNKMYYISYSVLAILNDKNKNSHESLAISN